MRRVLVIGCPGSGKSVFARKLGEINLLPAHHLDMLCWNEDKSTVLHAEFLRRLDGVLARDARIILRPPASMACCSA